MNVMVIPKLRSPIVLVHGLLGFDKVGVGGVTLFNYFRGVRELMIGMPFQAFYDLTRDRCKAFNENVLDVPSVRYFSVAGKHDGSILHPEWLLSFGHVTKHEGDNDGVVSVESAKYGEIFDVWEGD